MGSETEMLDSLSGVLWSSKENGVASGWSSESQLIQSQDLTTGGKNAGTGGSSEAESSNADLWDGEETVVIGDSSNDNNGSLLFLVGLSGNSGDRDGGSVDTGHKKSAEDDLVEGGLGSALKKVSTYYIRGRGQDIDLRAKKR